MRLPKQVPKQATEWRVSSFSENGGNCVEVAVAPVVRVRDTKARAHGQLAVPAAAWTALLTQVR